MTKKRLFVLGAHVVLIMLLLVSVASAQFTRIEGDPDGLGYGYGYGFGEGYGWDASLDYMAGIRLTSELANDVYGYGYGYGYLDSSIYNPSSDIFGIDGADPSSFMLLIIGGVAGVDGLELSVDPEGAPTFTGITFYVPVEFTIGSGITVEVGENTSFSSTVPLDLTDPGASLIGVAGIPVVDPPTGYSAISGSSLLFGLPSYGLTVSPAITININVGSRYNGTTLSVLHKAVGGHWVLLATCAVTANVCSFQTAHLSSFAVATYTAPAAARHLGGSGGNNLTVPGVTSSTTAVSIPVITKVLRYKMISKEVNLLQQLLKGLDYLSIKNTTNYFGVTTRDALKRYQKDRRLRASGITDVPTRAFLNQDLANPLLAKHAVINQLTKNLAYKSTGSMVKSLQEKLKKLGYFAGETTNYYGLVTKKAVTDFQKKMGIKPANGLVGSTTRATLNSL